MANYYNIVNGTFVYGDCLEVMPTIPDGYIDMILCDLPYGTTQNKWDSVISLPVLWTSYDRIAKENAAIALTAQTPFDKVLSSSNLTLLRYEWIWEKTNATGHLNANIAPLKAHENVLLFYRKQPVFNPIKTNGHVRKTATKRKDVTTNYGVQNFDAISYDSTERYPRSVIVFASDKQTSKLHSTQKPVALFEYLIRTYTDENQLVLDNCAGSGTTAIACENLNRRWICIENDAAIAAKAIERIRQHIENKANKILDN